MRIFKNIIAGLLALSLLLTLFSLLFSSTIKVNRDVIINAPAAKVQSMISDLKTWPKWFAPLNNPGQNMQQTIISSPAKIEWLNAEGKLNIVTIKKIDSFFVEAEFSSGSDRTLLSRFIFHPLDEGKHARLEWQAFLELGWLPWNKFSGIFAEKMIAPAQEQSLEKIRTILETPGDTANNN